MRSLRCDPWLPQKGGGATPGRVHTLVLAVDFLSTPTQRHPNPVSPCLPSLPARGPGGQTVMSHWPMGTQSPRGRGGCCARGRPGQ